MDFWFTGCHGCLSIPPVMKTIMDKFIHHEDVVLLSLSVDRTIEIWKSGLQSELYTLQNQLHFKTKGDERYDPFLIHYQVNAFPHIMLIGKDNKILSVASTDPRADQGANIMTLVQRALNNP